MLDLFPQDGPIEVGPATDNSNYGFHRFATSHGCPVISRQIVEAFADREAPRYLIRGLWQ
jgi:hypothetical protein